MFGKKTLSFQQILVLIIFFFLLVFAFTGYGLYQRTAGNLSEAEMQVEQSRRTIDGLFERLAKYEAPIPTPVPEPDVTNNEPDILSGLSDATKEQFQKSFPFGLLAVTQAKELSPGLVLAVLGNKSASVWLFDANTGRVKLITEATDVQDCANIEFTDWSGGVAVEVFTSPCEAVGREVTTYINNAGLILADTDYGDFNRAGNALDAHIGEKSLHVQLVQEGECRTPDYSTWDGVAPKTTLSGLLVNGRSFSFPQKIITSCAPEYGDAVGDVHFPTPFFDGKNIIFYLPGYKATLTSAATVSYTPVDLSVNGLFRTVNIPAPYLKRIATSGSRIAGVDTFISITDKPGHLFVSSGGPAGPGSNDFIDGVEIRIYESDEHLFDDYGTIKSTPYAGVWEDKDACEAACYGTIYRVRTQPGGYYIVTVDSHNFDEQKLRSLVDAVLGSIASQ